MLEMAIVLPVLLLMIFGIVEFGVVFGRWIAINNAAREGARTAIVFRTNCDSTQVSAEVLSRVQQYVSALGLEASSANVSVEGTCGAAGTDSSVTVSFPYNFRVLGGLAPALSPQLNLRGQSTMRNEGSS